MLSKGKKKKKKYKVRRMRWNGMTWSGTKCLDKERLVFLLKGHRTVCREGKRERELEGQGQHFCFTPGHPIFVSLADGAWEERSACSSCEGLGAFSELWGAACARQRQNHGGKQRSPRFSLWGSGKAGQDRCSQGRSSTTGRKRWGGQTWSSWWAFSPCKVTRK